MAVLKKMAAAVADGRTGKAIYRVNETCYFNARYFSKGDIVRYPIGYEVPEHFTLISEEPIVEKKKGLAS